MTFIPFSTPRQQFLDASGRPLAGGKLYTYQAGTTTPVSTWQEFQGAIPNTNPIILDAAGAAVIFFDPAQFYKIVLEDSLGVQQWTADNVNPCCGGAGGGGGGGGSGGGPIAALSFNPTAVLGSNTTTGTVTLTSPAPAGGAVVTLASSNFDLAHVPATVTVPANTSFVTFLVTTSAVNTETAVTVTATYGGSEATADITISAGIVGNLVSITLNPTSVVGGASVTGTALLSSPAGGGDAIVTLSCSDTSVAQTTQEVIILGGQTTGDFTVTTSGVTTDRIVTISGTYGNTQSASLNVNAPSGGTLIGVTLNPTQVTGGIGTTGTVTLDAPAPVGGVLVTLTSSNTQVATVPASVTIAAGQTTATFTVTTSSLVPTTTLVDIDASYAGTTLFFTLTINAPPRNLAAFALNPTTVTGGASSTGTVTLSLPAPTGGAIVTLAAVTNASSVTLPSSVTVAEGALTATFTVTTHGVTQGLNASIAATYSNTINAALTIHAPAPTAIFGGVGQAGGTVAGNFGSVLVLNVTNPSVELTVIQATQDQVGNSWSFVCNNQVIYLCLWGGSRTFVDGQGRNFVFNAPILQTQIQFDGIIYPMYLYQTTNALIGTFTVTVKT